MPVIGKTRQPTAPDGKALDQGIVASRGVLRLPATERPDVSRWAPPPRLSRWIAYTWMVRWDLTGLPAHTQETAPHPNVYLIFDNGRLEVSGVSTKKFVRLLEGKGQAFGVKFQPGGFRPFLSQPVSWLTDRILPAHTLFGEDAARLERTLLAAKDDGEIVEAVYAFFLPRVPPFDTHVDTAAKLVEFIFTTPEMKTVDDLARFSGIKKRSLQRLFNEYVGVPPKWVIRRYRLHELIDRLNRGEELDGASLALELGYFDQAHLINDFRSMTGSTPAQYRQASLRLK